MLLIFRQIASLKNSGGLLVMRISDNSGNGVLTEASMEVKGVDVPPPAANQTPDVSDPVCLRRFLSS